MKKLLLSCLVAMSMVTYAQVGPPQATNPNTNNGYGFAQSNGSYTPLSASRTIWQSGAALGTDAVSAAINLPSAFKYNGKSYSTVYISNNGFVTFGNPALASTTTGLSSNPGVPYEGAVAGFSANLRNANTTSSEISYETVGSKFIVQFTDLQGNSASTAQAINFQIQLNTSNNSVAIVYGTCTSGTASLTGQVGLKGGESSDMSNRTGTDWTAIAVGTSTSSTCTLGSTNSSTVPASGLTFEFTPGTWVSTMGTYATLPFSENFGSWVNGNSTADLPNANNWRTWPSRGDNSWRASNIAATATGFTSTSGWADNSESSGSITPITAPAVAPAARFHSYQTSVSSYGYMDLFVDLSSGGAGERVLTFDYINTSGTDNLKIQLSTDGGTTFTSIGSTLGVSANWSSKNFALGSVSSTAIIRFLATGDFGDTDIFIDNVNVSPITCLMPDTVTVGTATATTESVSWTITTPAPSYDIYYSTTNTAPTSGSTPNVIGATGTTNTLTNLAPLTTYYVWVRSRCSSSDQSIWIVGPSFTTKAFCPEVTAPASSAIGVSVTPTFTWTANADATGYRVSIGTTSGGTDVLNNADVGNVTTYTLSTPLNTSTTYYYTVNSYNAGVTSTSCTVRSFTTVCGTMIPSYTNDFASFPGACWSLANGGTPATGPGTGTTNYWVVDGFLNVGSTGAAKINLYTIGRQGWLKSPVFNLSAGGYRVKFDYGLTKYNVTTSSAMGSDDVVQFVVSTDGGTTWTVLKTWDAANAPSNTLNTYIFDLTAYTGANTMFAVYGSDGTVDDTPDYEFFVDNFVVESIPTCEAPTGVNSSLITESSATISWTAPAIAPANGYQYYFSTTNTAPTAGSPTTANSQILSPLLPQTTYYYWVRSMCAGTQSVWVPGSFTTLAPPPANDNCSSAIDLVVGGTFAQNAVTGTTVGSTNTPALTASCLTAPTNVGGNVWYKIVVPASGSVTVETDIATGSTLDDTVLSIFADCSTTTSIACNDDGGNDSFSKISLTGQTPGATLYLSVWRYSNAGSGTDGPFKISAYDSSLLTTSEVSAAKNELKAYPNPFADVLNISDISKVKSVSIVDLAGRVVKTIDNPSSALQLGDLKQGMYLVTLNMKDGSKQTIKAIKK